VRVDTDGSVDLRVVVGEAHGPVNFRRTVTGSDGQDAGDPGGGGTVENGIEVVGEALVVQVAVGIDEHYSSSGGTASPAQIANLPHILI
jgi:hypothetical protein